MERDDNATHDYSKLWNTVALQKQLKTSVQKTIADAMWNQISLSVILSPAHCAIP